MVLNFSLCYVLILSLATVNDHRLIVKFVAIGKPIVQNLVTVFVPYDPLPVIATPNNYELEFQTKSLLYRETGLVKGSETRLIVETS